MAIALDDKQFRRAVTGWAAASGKTYAEGENRFMVKLLIGGRGLRGAVHYTAQAFAARIKNTGDSQPALVAWLLKRKYGESPRITHLSDRRSVIYTREEAQEFARRHFNARAQAAGFLKRFPVFLARAIRSRTKSVERTTNSRKGSKRGFQTYVRRARPKSLTADAAISFTFKNALAGTAAEHAKDTERLLQRGIDKAMPGAIRDTVQYIEKKQAKAARKFSA